MGLEWKQHAYRIPFPKFDKDPIKVDWENAEPLFFPLYVNGSFLLPW